jgi:hypothetical protein
MRKSLTGGIFAQCFGRVASVSEHDLWLAVLIATGWAMAAHYDLFGDDSLQLKLGLVGLVVALTLLHLVRPRVNAIQAAILLASPAIVWLGLDLTR